MLGRGKTHTPSRPCACPGGRRALGGGGFHQDRLRRRPSHGTNDGGDAGGNRLAVASLSRREFYKSMTTYADHRVWQDVYHAATPMRKDAYIKITLRDAAPVIQFKEK
jgi:hypothetical protein